MTLTLYPHRYNRQQAALPMIHAIINTNPKPAPRGKGKRAVSIKKGYCVNFGFIAEDSEKPSVARGKWEIAAKRELGNVPVSAFEIRSVLIRCVIWTSAGSSN